MLFSRIPVHPVGWITLRLRGTRANRFGVGARLAVTVRTPGGRRTLHRLGGSGGSFGGSSLQQEIGLGDAEGLEELVVTWPGSGTVDRIPGAEMNRFYELEEGTGTLRALEVLPVKLGGY